jgi:cell division protein ZapA (FtsZ GTPase activity inhibitor)
MKEEISIKVNIADVVYPMTISREDEENVRKAAKMINEQVKRYREEYGIADKGNILSMVALQLASELLQYQQRNHAEDTDIAQNIRQINHMLDTQLRNL